MNMHSMIKHVGHKKQFFLRVSIDKTDLVSVHEML